MNVLNSDSVNRRKIFRSLLLVLFGLCACRAVQAQSSGSAPTRPQQVPLSGRSASSGNVVVTQQPAGTGSGGVDTLSTTLKVGGSYSGSVLGPGANTAGTRMLTISEAIRRGLAYNLGTRTATSNERQAMANQTGTRAALLPNISTQFSENVDKVNLQATGFDAAALGSIGQYFPVSIGPFTITRRRPTTRKTSWMS